MSIKRAGLVDEDDEEDEKYEEDDEEEEEVKKSRRKIRKKAKKKADLVERLKSELSGNLKECVMALFVSPEEYDAWCVRNAIYVSNVCYLNELINHRCAVFVTVVAFPDLKAPENALEEDIEGDTSGDYKRLLISTSQDNCNIIDLERLEEAVEKDQDMPTGMFAVNHDKLVNVGRAERDTQKLMFEADQDSWGTDETFYQIFSIRDLYQLRRTCAEYLKGLFFLVNRAASVNPVSLEICG
ncbi:Annexin A5 [Mizuhopecten yessoensis]|uniref:Annexin A5 n=1 Tax=Mizuhopecten yessoensis TaxID=6573 RepID=A0A210PV24_MIZYE|nr:Annexin A5 [Mizuhopecten yessoensis]